MFSQLLTIGSVALGVNAVSHNIDVGKSGLVFSPNTTIAAVGDTLQFHFYSGGHSAVEGIFSSPCEPATNGFFSGYMPGSTNGEMTFVVDVTTTDPIWFYCSLSFHCGSGMVGVVNPPADQTIDQYAAAAAGLSQASAPAAVAGGVVTTISESTGVASTSMAATTSASVATTTASSGSGSATMVSATTTSGSASAAKTGSAITTSASASATSTHSNAGHAAELSIMLGLTVVLGGLVALMA